MNKALFRAEIIGKRDALPLSERVKNSEIITKKILALDEFKDAITVAAFIPIKSEVDITGLNKFILERGRTLVLPFVKNEFELTFKKLSGFERLSSDIKGIPAPEETAPEVPLDKIDIFIVPGLLFDLNKNRMGYGKGYYDKTLSLVKSKKLFISPAFEIQIKDEIPVLEHDVPVDIIVTEKRIIK